jgi:hypothetical protein
MAIGKYGQNQLFLEKICRNEKEGVILLPESSDVPLQWHDYCL